VKISYIITYRVTHWEPLEDIFVLWHNASGVVIEHTNGKCHVFIF
jgi:hypothetical protein